MTAPTPQHRSALPRAFLLAFGACSTTAASSARCKGRYPDCKNTDLVASYHDHLSTRLDDLHE